MKKILVLAFVLVLALSGCSEKKKAGESVTEEVDSYAEDMNDTLGDQFSAPSEAVTKAVSGTWIVADSEDTYELKTDGTGRKNDEALTFECGFDDEKNITLKIKMDGSDTEELYAISTDETGYGIRLTALDGGGNLYLLPADIEFLDVNDERAKGIIGKWSDGNGNIYQLNDDMSMEIIGDGGSTEGSFSIVEDKSGTLLMRIVVSGGSLEYEYTLNEDGTQMDLVSPGTDTVHQWTKE